MKKTCSSKRIKRILQQDISIPITVRNSINSTLSMINNSASDKTKNKVISFRHKRLLKNMAAAFAIFILCAGATTAAAAIIKWNSKVANSFEVNTEQQEELTQSGVSSMLNASDTQNGVTIHAEQALADEKYIYALFKITTPKNISLSGDTLFNEIKITSEGQKIKSSYFGGWLENDNSTTDDQTNNEKYWEIWINQKDGCKLQGKDITITFTDLMSLKSNKVNTAPLVNSEWNITWNTGNSGVAKKLEINKVIPEFHTTVKEISLSPISIKVLYDYKRTEQTEQVSNEDGTVSELHEYKRPATPVSFQLEDGNIIDIPNGGPGSEGYTDNADLTNNEYFISFSFNKVIDIEKITAIIFKEMDNAASVTVPIH